MKRATNIGVIAALAAVLCVVPVVGSQGAGTLSRVVGGTDSAMFSGSEDAPMVVSAAEALVAAEAERIARLPERN
jgi:hypothetical protein